MTGLTSPVTGGAQTGLTSPTYTLSPDTAPDTNGIQYAVTALGGTQTDVRSHGAAVPFTITIEKPKTFKRQGSVNQVTGVAASIPMNSYKVRVRKGVSCDTSIVANDRVANATLSIDVPSGSEGVNPIELRAMISLMVGALNQYSSGLGSTVVSNVFS